MAGVEGVVAPNAVSMMRDSKAVSAGGGGGGGGGSLALEAKMDEQTALPPSGDAGRDEGTDCSAEEVSVPADPASFSISIQYCIMNARRLDSKVR